MTEEQTTNNNTNPVAKTQLSVPVAIIIAGLIVAGAIVFSGGIGVNTNNNNGGGNAEEGLSLKDRLELAEIQPDDYVLGNRNADVYILEFSDTECPFCKQFHNTMHEIVDEYDGEVAWVYRHFPLESLHRKAFKEAEATECAGEMGGNDAFWAYTDKIYEITPSNDGLDLAQLPEIAEQVGLNRAEFEECLESGRLSKNVTEDFENGIALGASGTPHPLIISKKEITQIRGAQPFAEVKASLDRILGN